MVLVHCIQLFWSLVVLVQHSEFNSGQRTALNKDYYLILARDKDCLYKDYC